MEEETKVWKIVMAAICTVIATIAGCDATNTYNNTRAIAEIVERGADPIDARCAVYGGGNECVVRATRKIP
jgi:hypothetical protein